MAEGSGWLFLHQETEHQDSIVKAAFRRRIFQIKVTFITLTRHFEIILCTNSIGFLGKIHHNAPPMSSIIYIHTYKRPKYTEDTNPANWYFSYYTLQRNSIHLAGGFLSSNFPGDFCGRRGRRSSLVFFF